MNLLTTTRRQDSTVSDFINPNIQKTTTKITSAKLKKKKLEGKSVDQDKAAHLDIRFNRSTVFVFLRFNGQHRNNR